MGHYLDDANQRLDEWAEVYRKIKAKQKAKRR
jgi:hypothetical protein